MGEPIVNSKKELAITLSKLRVFEQPRVQLEQYPTDSEVAADLLWQAHMRGDVQDKHVLDLGCGTGILGIGALLLGARHTTFVDIDTTALETLQKNLETLPECTPEQYDLVHSEVSTLPTPEEPVDLVIMNPPFGTRDEHADLLFLTKALETAPLVYSMHKTSTISYLEQWLKKNEARITHKTAYDFPIKQTFSHQTKRIERIDVTCLRIERNN